MNQISKTLMGGVIAIALTTSCSKEESNQNLEFTSVKHKTAKQMEYDAYKNFAGIDESMRKLQLTNAEAIISGKIKKSTEDPELEEAFVNIEGLINYNFDTELEMFEETAIYSDTYDLSYYINEGRYYVETEEFTNVYQEIYNDLNNQIGTTEDLVLLVDMEIEDMDTVSQVVIIRANAVMTPGPGAIELWQPPSTGYYAAAGAGVCDGTPNVNWQSGTDAATILQGYVNSGSFWKARCGSAGGYLIPMGALHSFNDSWNDPYMLVDVNQNYNTWQDVINHYWKSNTNDCLGNTEQQWTDLAGDINYLRNYGQARVQAQIHPNAEFFVADYHSHDENKFPGDQNTNIPEQFYHGGTFYYGIVTCH